MATTTTADEAQEDSFMVSFLNRIVVQPQQDEEEIVTIDKHFYSEDDKLTSYVAYVQNHPDRFDSNNYFVHFVQLLPDGESQHITYPLFYLDQFNQHLDAIFKGEGQQLLFNRKFKGIGNNKLLTEYRRVKYIIENKGSDVTTVYQKRGRVVEAFIEIKNINAFIKLLEDVDRHAESYLEKLAADNGRDIEKEQEALNN